MELLRPEVGTTDSNRVISASAGVPRASAVGALTGSLTYFVAMGVTMAVVPRQPEGVRQVVTIPWPVYAWIPAAAGLVVLLFVAFAARKPSRRLFILVAGSIALAFCAYHGVDLLRRDFIGKF